MLSVLLIYGVIFITTYWLGRGFLHAFRLTPSGALSQHTGWDADFCMRSGLLLPAQMLSYIP